MSALYYNSLIKKKQYLFEIIKKIFADVNRKSDVPVTFSKNPNIYSNLLLKNPAGYVTIIK